MVDKEIEWGKDGYHGIVLDTILVGGYTNYLVRDSYGIIYTINPNNIIKVT